MASRIATLSISPSPVPRRVGAPYLDTECVHALQAVTSKGSIGNKHGKVSLMQLACHPTLLLLCVVAIVEGADMQLLPATFRALEADLKFTPLFLGQMSLAQALSQSLCAPVWGFFADRYCRKRLLVISCFGWGILTTFLAAATTRRSMLILRFFHGSFLASLKPIAQSVVADVTHPNQRGAAYGLVGLSVCIGMVLASLIGSSMAELTFFNVRGWRVAFLLTAIVSFIVGYLVHRFMEPFPSYAPHDLSLRLPNDSSRIARCQYLCATELQRIFGLLRIRTFAAIALQGFFGTVPWNAMGFMTMYLQYCGHPAPVAAVIASTVIIGKGFGTFLGGLAGDAFARFSPSHGRPCLAQISVLSGVPMLYLLVLESSAGSSASMLIFISLLLGLMSSWCVAGVNQPILAEVVDVSGRSSVIGLLAALEGSSGAVFGAPLVGALSEHIFDYVKEDEAMHLNTTSRDAALRRETNKHALGSSMLWASIPTWSICCVVYGLLHYTYSADVAAQRVRDSVKFEPVSTDDSCDNIELPAKQDIISDVDRPDH